MSPEFEKLMKDLREEGREEGIEVGITNTLISLVKKGLLNIKDAATQANMTEENFKSLMLA